VPDGAVMIVGGTSGLGLEVARHYVEAGRKVYVTGHRPEHAPSVAKELGGETEGLVFDLTEPASIAGAVADVGPIDYLVLAAISRDENTVREYKIEQAEALATLKLVGYTATINALLPKMHDDSAVVLFGGRAKDRPYPGSVTVTSVNGAMSSIIRALATELKPIRFNTLHPGIVGDSPYWEGKPQALEATLARTPTGRLATMADIVDAVRFLLENRSVNGIDLYVDGGWMLM
jgi:NAD(P)-dependent dehydrogenase (short-subunit alcohol dehydrogenase family)